MGPIRFIVEKLNPSPFKVGCLIIVFSCALFYSFGGQKPHLLESLDNQIIDAMFRIRGTQPTHNSVIIVDIDEKSLAELGQWPWPRNIVAGLVKNLTDAGAKAIGFDIVFAEKDRASPKNSIDPLSNFLSTRFSPPEIDQLRNSEALDYDIILGDTIAESPTVLGYVFQTLNDGLKNEDDRPFPSINISTDPGNLNFTDLSFISNYRAIVNIPDIATAQTEGFFNVFPDPSGTVRKVPLFMEMDGVPYPSLALETLRIGQQIPQVTIHAAGQTRGEQNTILGVTIGDKFIPTDNHCQVTVNFRGGTKTFPYMSALDVFNNKGTEAVKDKYVLIGTTAAGLLDLRATPFSNVFPGVEVHANLIDNILGGDPLTYDIFTEIGLTYTIIIVGGLILNALLVYSSPLIGGLGGVILITTYLLFGNYYYFFLDNQIVGITFPLLTIFAIFLFVTLFNYFFKEREKQFIQGAFGHYVSPQVVNQLIKTPDKLSLSGEEKKLTIFFNDIRGFTTISERMNSQQLGIFMNEYLTAMSNVIMDHKGTVDKYIGDAIMALWGAPLDDDAQAENAVRASLHMLERLEEIKPEWHNRGLPAINIGIGLNTGVVSVGNFGSDQRFDYTVLGDAVNLASRLESLNKMYGTNILISAATKAELPDSFYCRFVDMVRVKGKKEPVTIYQPLVEGTPNQQMVDEVSLYSKAIDCYQNKKFDEAENILKELSQKNHDSLYTLYLDRISAFKEEPPPEQWDGVFTATSK